MKEPVRLDKTDNADNLLLNKFVSRIEDWAWEHAPILLLLCLITLLLLFVALCFTLVGASATESGLQYNQLENII